MKKKQRELLAALVVHALPALDTYRDMRVNNTPFGGSSDQGALHANACARAAVKKVTGLDPSKPQDRNKLLKMITDG